MTNEVRQDPESKTVMGTVFHLTAFVHVPWPWTAYLAMLCGVAPAFLPAVICSTVIRDASDCKSSVLPFPGPEQWRAGDGERLSEQYWNSRRDG